VPRHQPFEGAGGEQRHVARQQDERAAGRRKRRFGHEHGVGRAKLGLLDDKGQPRATDQRALQLVGLMPDDDRDAAGRESGRGAQDVVDHRCAGHLMQHLRA
jgi:hypothetical protein